MNIIKTLPILILFAFSISLSAQEHRKEDREERSKIIDEMKRSFIKERLDLSEEKATSFITMMEEYNQAKKAIKKEAYAKKELKESEKGSDKVLTETEANLMLNRKIEAKEKLLNLERDYIAKSIQEFTAVKVLEYYKAEREFKKELFRKLEEKKQRKKEH